ncbi:uncharacterized protein LOC143183041 [Calliopsis andreniformis]|uniref:uncharacterized protein LOC143183041 n=1 Tax=Calliopsis andreniformis TaxID=337506 RepID=UPI003FCCB21A
MEVVEVSTKKRSIQLPCYKPTDCPCNVKCTKRYVQPSRVKSFAPERMYQPPSKVLETDTTYHLSYLNLDHAEMRRSRSQPIRPIPALSKPDGKFCDETTNRLSYKTVGHVPKTKPILPRQRPMIGLGRMECITTVRQDYARKYIEKPDLIVPCGNIRLSSGKLEGSTTAKLSYVDPGPTEPTANFKPIRIYCPPSEPLLDDTTQKLSYQPLQVPQKEVCPWQLKPTYRSPDVAMCGKTTYTESFLKNDEPCMEKPIKPTGTDILPRGGEFAAKTIYKESFLESNIERVEPFIPCNSIPKPDGIMSGDTTSKMSYQSIQSEKRSPILPRSRRMIGDGPMQSETTNRMDFAPKITVRPDLIVPCNNLRSAETPMDDRTTTRMSYLKPQPTEFVQSFKPIAQYSRLPQKIECDTVSKLSYQSWTPLPKEKVPWAIKSKYEPPTDPMCSDTIYQASYPVPGHYEEVCIDVDDCDCLRSTDVCPANVQTNIQQEC